MSRHNKLAPLHIDWSGAGLLCVGAILRLSHEQASANGGSGLLLERRHDVLDEEFE